jgi:hypothetical protein
LPTRVIAVTISTPSSPTGSATDRQFEDALDGHRPSIIGVTYSDTVVQERNATHRQISDAGRVSPELVIGVMFSGTIPVVEKRDSGSSGRV